MELDFLNLFIKPLDNMKLSDSIYTEEQAENFQGRW